MGRVDPGGMVKDREADRALHAIPKGSTAGIHGVFLCCCRVAVLLKTSSSRLLGGLAEAIGEFAACLG